MMDPDLVVAVAAEITAWVMAVAVVLGALRLAIGPSRADRVIALDLVTILSIAVVVLVAVIADRAVMLDAAMAVALIAFLGTIGFARYLRRRGRGRQGRREAAGGTAEPGSQSG